MARTSTATTEPVRVGLIGAGRIGTSHARLLSRHVPGADLRVVVDPRPGVADVIAGELGCAAATDPAEVFADGDIEGVAIAASSEAHADLVEGACIAGNGVFCEKPMGMNLHEADRAISAAQASGVLLQVGFNRRFDAGFSAARHVIETGGIGTPQLMRSLTRDPGLADSGAVPPWTIFLQTLIHDFDTLLWLNPGAQPTSVYATADALVAPDFKAGGLLDTAVVVITFDNGAIATAEASFSARYGYDVRAEVFGSGGMVTMGDGARSSLVLHDGAGRHVDTARGDVELLRDAYTGEFVEFVDAVREGRQPEVTGVDARRALRIALASVESVTNGAPVRLDEVAS